MKPAWSAEHKSQVREELQAIMESEAFSGSRRGQQFLQYVVDTSLAGRSELLKERSIGVELFGRAPTYDTGEDSVVRVTAGDIRHRLKRYEDSLRAPRAVQIHLPPGSYTPEFVFTPAPKPAVRSFSRFRTRVMLAVLVGAVVLAGGVYGFLRVFDRKPTERFWAPLKSSQAPVLISVTSPPAYYFPHPTERLGKAGASVPVEEIFQVGNVNPVDAQVAVELSSFLGGFGKTSQSRPSASTVFDDLRGSATLLIGGFGNQWMLQMTKQLHFTYYRDVGKEWLIREQAAPWRHWAIPESAISGPAPTAERDYALISRVFDRETGRPFVAVGDIGAAGTRAAAECVMSNPCLAAATENVRRDWEQRNLQFVITARIVSGAPTAPEVLATYCW